MTLNANNMEAANREKHAVEEHQRNQVKLRQEENITWTPHYFNLINNIYSLKGMSRSVLIGLIEIVRYLSLDMILT
jgi:hypothetical protein